MRRLGCSRIVPVAKSLASVMDEPKGLGVIRQGKDRGLGKLGNECSECSLMCRGPFEGSILQG